MLRQSHNLTTVSLIGMPGVGKSTIGVLLAKILGLGFVDTDLNIQLRERATLQEILERSSYQQLRAIEETVLLEIQLNQTLISTGGSAIYSDRGIQRLAKAGPLIYLKADIGLVEKRVALAPSRGIASDPRQSFAEVYVERTQLYEYYADLTEDASLGSAEDIALRICARLKKA